MDDDDESVQLEFGTMPDARVSAGAIGAATVSITDDDDPFVTAMYDQSSYTVAEGGTQTVTVTLSADPERTIIIPIEKTDQGGADSADYSGVPSSVTFNAGEMSKPFTISASPGRRWMTTTRACCWSSGPCRTSGSTPGSMRRQR